MQTTGQNKQDTLKKHTSEHESIFGGIHSSMLMSANTELRGMETGGLHNSCTAADQLGSNCGQNRGKCSCKTPEPQQLPLFIERNGSPSTIMDWNRAYFNRNMQQPNQGRGRNQPSSNNAHQVTTTTVISEPIQESAKLMPKSRLCAENMLSPIEMRFQGSHGHATQITI